MTTGEDGGGEAPDARYRIIRRLGSGGTATVHLAEDVRLGRPVAIKRLHAESPDDAVRRFRREARVGAAFTHPNMVTIYDAHSDEESVVIVMEYVEGETLAQALERGPMEPDAALAILRPVAAALDTAHAQGVVHRDVKPANILLGDAGRVKLTDFGIASAAESTRITQAGSMLGTLGYMAPEQLTGEDVSAAADVYSLAAVAYEMLSGRKSRGGDSPFEIMRRADTDPPPDLRDALPGAPAAAADALKRGMARESDKRQLTAGTFVEELARGLRPEVRREPKPVAAVAPAPAPPRPAPPRPAPPESPPTPPRREPPRREPERVVAAPGFSRRRRTLGLLVVLAAIVVLGVIALASSGGGGGGRSGNVAATTPRTTAAKPEKTTTTPPATGTQNPPAATTPAAPAPAPAPAAGAPLSPADTVRAFYERTAAGQYEQAYALLAPAFKAQFGSFAEYKRELGTLRSVRFDSLRTVSQSAGQAVVALTDVATHTTRVDTCHGELALVRGPSGGWLVNPRSVSCTSAKA